LRDKNLLFFAAIFSIFCLVFINYPNLYLIS
jgi:hypothetical protein